MLFYSDVYSCFSFECSKFMEDGLRGILSALFQVLLPQMEQLMQFGERMDSLYVARL